MPGVIYSRQIEFTAHGPVVLHVIAAPRPTGLYALKPILSNNAVLGRERVTSMEKRVSADATVAGVNGDVFSFSDGHPTGGLIRGGILDTAPAGERSTIGIDTDGLLHVERVSLDGTWQGSGQRRIVGINEPPRANHTTLYTRAWGARTPAESGGAYAILEPFPATKPNTPLTATVAGFAPGGNQPIPADGAVLVARGSQAGFLPAEAPAGSKVTIVLTLTPPWANVPEAVGGGPMIVRDGKLLNRPSDRLGERAVAEALTLFYYGVYAPPLASKAVAPNASLTVSYKLARPSTVTATMNGPGGAIVPVDSGARAPGVYRLNWSAAGQPQGSWTFRVVADDDQGRHSVAERDFTVRG